MLVRFSSLGFKPFAVQVHTTFTFTPSPLPSQVAPLQPHLYMHLHVWPQVLPDPSSFPIKSGVGNGVEILVDLETFDNADLEVSFYACLI